MPISHSALMLLATGKTVQHESVLTVNSVIEELLFAFAAGIPAPLVSVALYKIQDLEEMQTQGSLIIIWS